MTVTHCLTRPLIVGNLAALVIVFAAGCQGAAKERDAKREQDRTMMRLSEAEKQRDEYKAQVEQLRASVATAEQRAEQARNELDASNGRLRQAMNDLDKARAGAAGAEQAGKQVELMQNKLKESAERQENADKTIAALRVQLDEAERRVAALKDEQRKASADLAERAGAPASPTQPIMNK